jgi:hypothetical protein
MKSQRPRIELLLATLSVLALEPGVAAHSGPPFPIVSNRTAGAYTVSIWTDPDATDDGKAAGRFWVVVETAEGTVPLPSDTRVTVAIWPVGRPNLEHAAQADPADAQPSRRFALLPMDHEGPFAVRVTLQGRLGSATVEGAVDATYDRRPAPFLLGVYLLPFVLVGGLWIKVLLRRRRCPG